VRRNSMRIGVLVVVLAVAVAARAARAKEAIGFSVSSLSTPRSVAMVEGARAAAEKAGLELVVLDARDKTEKQAADIDDLLAIPVRVILLHPVDTLEVVPAIEKANAAEVPVITVERPAAGGKVAYHILSDEVAGGHLVADYLCRLVSGRGEVALLEGSPDSPMARQRGQGFNSALKRSCRGVRLAATGTAHSDRAEGLTVMENLLQAHPSIEAVFAEDDEMALGAVHAASPAGRPLRIVGYGASEDGLKAVEGCDLAATVDEQPAQMGRSAVERALSLIRLRKEPERTVLIEIAPKLVTSPSCP
jgi:ribose transport system substrate-binding protein